MLQRKWLRSMLLGLVLVSVTLAGCGDDGSDGSDNGDGGDGTSGGDDGDGTSGGDGGDGGDGTGGGDGGEGAMPLGPQYINGTVTGVLDCTLVAQGGTPLGGDSTPIGSELWNGTYTITTSGDQVGTATVCIYFDGIAAGNTGTVPSGATQVTVYADTAPTGVAYSIRVDPVT